MLVPRMHPIDQMTFMKLDLSSLAAVRAFVSEFKESKLGLDSLILNAGVMHSVSQSRRIFRSLLFAYFRSRAITLKRLDI